MNLNGKRSFLSFHHHFLSLVNVLGFESFEFHDRNVIAYDSPLVPCTFDPFNGKFDAESVRSTFDAVLPNVPIQCLIDLEPSDFGKELSRLFADHLDRSRCSLVIPPVFRERQRAQSDKVPIESIGEFHGVITE